MEILFLVGRITFGGYFIMAGLNHFKYKKSMARYASSKGVSSPEFAVMGTGLLMLLGGLGVLLGVYTQVALWLLIIFLVPASFKMHNFWTVQDPAAKMSEQINFMKNMALAGAALMMMFISEPWVLSVTLV
jgi:putative oxidoreductase